MNFRATLRPLAFLILILAGAQLFPLLMSFFEQQEIGSIRGFLLSILLTGGLGGLLWWAGRGADEQLHRKEGLFIVAATWISAGVLGGLPFLISGAIPSPLDAAFESISGFTTTGASILTDIEVLPRSILLWRSMTHWLGGMGIVVLFVAILPALGIGGKHLYRIEATGPSVSSTHARATSTARTLWLIYAGISLVEFIFLWAGEMNWFDAICHTFGTMATGGFSTMNASVGAFGTYTHVIITIFMFICGVNFSLYYQALRRKWLFYKDAEFRLYVSITLIAVIVLFIAALQYGDSVGRGIRDAFFTAISILTTTGFGSVGADGTANFEKWPYYAQGLLVMLMFIGGSAGSTGGGMKVVRILIVSRWAWKHIVHAFRPRELRPLRIGGIAIERDIEDQVVSFFLLFMGWFVLGIMVLLFCGHDLATSLTASVAAVANIGPGLGDVGPAENYASIHPVAKGMLAVLMLVGRLEVLAITVLVFPAFWRR